MAKKRSGDSLAWVESQRLTSPSMKARCEMARPAARSVDAEFLVSMVEAQRSTLLSHSLSASCLCLGVVRGGVV
jgi:hypothetical protein